MKRAIGFEIPGQPIHPGRNDHIDLVMLNIFRKLTESGTVDVSFTVK